MRFRFYAVPDTRDYITLKHISQSNMMRKDFRLLESVKFIRGKTCHELNATSPEDRCAISRMSRLPHPIRRPTNNSRAPFA